MTRNAQGYSSRDYGLKVIDPVTKEEIFNSKYPIFGSDITNKTPQIVSRRVVINNNTRIFSEPNNPQINWTYAFGWDRIPITQFQDFDFVRIPHGQPRKPFFMSMGRAHIVHRMYCRWFNADQNFTVDFNNIVTPGAPGSGYYTYDIPFMLTEGSALWNPLSYGAFDFVLPLPNNPVSPSIWLRNMYTRSKKLEIFADNTYIYVRGSLGSWLQHRSERLPGGGYHQFAKTWVDLSGSWFDFTFYIFPYNPNEDIFVR
nr:MAG TPA: hypothetical protein [Caudoviricetes sp.]